MMQPLKQQEGPYKLPEFVFGEIEEIHEDVPQKNWNSHFS
jgi:hypothetical protein